MLSNGMKSGFRFELKVRQEEAGNRETKLLSASSSGLTIYSLSILQ